MHLSIITVNYNNKSGLEKTAVSIASQTLRDFEWIIIDGGSTDGSKELIESMTACPNVNITYWCSEPDKGIYNAMNKGITHAKGSYVNFMNTGDFFYDSNVLENIMPILLKHEADVIYGDVSNEHTDHSEVRRYPENLSFRWLLKDTINHQASFIRLDTLKKFMYDESYTLMADRKFWLQLYTKGYSFKHVPFVIARYDHTGNTWGHGNWPADVNRLFTDFIPSHIMTNNIFIKIWKAVMEVTSRIRKFIRQYILND